MRMHLEGVKNPQITQIQIGVICGWLSDLPPAAPTSVVRIAIAITASTFESVVTISITAIASEDIAKTRISISIRSATIPTTIARVMAVNKLRTLLVRIRVASASTTSLGHRVGRQAD